jgi:peptidoglycan/LPS O-acetylase OafA/YrhL
MRADERTMATRSRRAALAAADSSVSAAEQAGHLGVLDGVRGLAILLVLVYHFTLGMAGRDLASRLLFRLSAAGWCGVDLFFVLSGFLITGILYDARESSHRFRNFYARRALRVFPLYYATLAVIFWLLPCFTGVTRRWVGLDEARRWLWTYTTNIHVALRGDWFPLSHFWSLAVEEHFYLVWPAIIFGCRRKTALRICAGMILLAVAVRTWLVIEGAVLAAYCSTICRMDALAMGGFLALVLRGPAGLDRLAAIAGGVVLASATALLVLCGWRFGLFLFDPVIQIAGYTLLDLFFAGLLIEIVAAPRASPLGIVFESAPLRWLGRYSYGLYVFNSIFLLAAEQSFLMRSLVAWSGSTIVGRVLHLIAGSLATFLAAWLSWHLLEQPFLKLKRRFADERKSGRTGVRASVRGSACPAEALATANERA